MIEVEVPEDGTVVVQQGDGPHDVRESPAIFMQCYCTDGKHGRWFWDRALIYSGHRKNVEPHEIGVQKFELVWEVK